MCLCVLVLAYLCMCHVCRVVVGSAKRTHAYMQRHATHTPLHTHTYTHIYPHTYTQLHTHPYPYRGIAMFERYVAERDLVNEVCVCVCVYVCVCDCSADRWPYLCL